MAALVGGLVALAVVRLTSRKQSDLARHERDVAALSDFIAVSEAQFWESTRKAGRDEDLTFPNEHFIPHRAALKRLQMSDGWGKQVGDALDNLPHLMQNLAAKEEYAKRVRRNDVAEKANNALNGLSSMAAVSLPEYPSAMKKDRVKLLKTVNEYVSEGRGVLRAIEEELKT